MCAHCPGPAHRTCSACNPQTHSWCYRQAILALIAALLWKWCCCRRTPPARAGCCVTRRPCGRGCCATHRPCGRGSPIPPSLEGLRVKPIVFLPAVASGVLLWTTFFPLNLGPLAFVALVPWLTLVRAPVTNRQRYLAAYLGGVVFFLL